MPPQFENKTAVPTSNPTMQGDISQHLRLIFLTIVMIFVGLIAIWYFLFYQNKTTSEISIPQNNIVTPVATTTSSSYLEKDITNNITETGTELKKFTSDTYRFSFEYPTEWTLSDQEYVPSHDDTFTLTYPAGDQAAVQALPVSDVQWDDHSKQLEIASEGNEEYMSFRIETNANPDSLPIQDWFNKTLANNIDMFKMMPSVEVGGMSAVQIVASDIGETIITYVPRGKDIIEINYSRSNKYDSIHNQILSTFKFISTSTPVNSVRYGGLSFSFDSNNDILVTDPLGNQTGYTSQKQIQNIPNSSYFTDCESKCSTTLAINQNYAPSGDYLMNVNGKAGNYSISITGFPADTSKYSLSEIKVAGNLQTDSSIDKYRISFSADMGTVTTTKIN